MKKFLMMLVSVLFLFGCEKKELDMNQAEKFIQQDLVSSFNQGSLVISMEEGNGKYDFTYHYDQDEFLLKGENYEYAEMNGQCFYHEGDIHYTYPQTIYSLDALIYKCSILDFSQLEEGLKEAKVQSVNYNKNGQCFDVLFNFELANETFEGKVQLEDHGQLQMKGPSYSFSNPHYNCLKTNEVVDFQMDIQNCKEANGLEIRNILNQLGNYAPPTFEYTDYFNPFYYPDFRSLKELVGIEFDAYDGTKNILTENLDQAYDSMTVQFSNGNTNTDGNYCFDGKIESVAIWSLKNQNQPEDVITYLEFHDGKAYLRLDYDRPVPPIDQFMIQADLPEGVEFPLQYVTRDNLYALLSKATNITQTPKGYNFMIGDMKGRMTHHQRGQVIDHTTGELVFTFDKDNIHYYIRFREDSLEPYVSSYYPSSENYQIVLDTYESALERALNK